MIRESNIVHLYGETIELPLADNTSEAVLIYRTANERFRQTVWPSPYDRTDIASGVETRGTCLPLRTRVST